MPAPTWWAPLLVDLAAIQRGSVPHGLGVETVDLADEVAHVTVHWREGTRTTLAIRPDADRAAVLDAITGAGPASGPPEGHDDEFWVPENPSPLLGHAWLMDDLGRHSDAWTTYAGEPVELRRIHTDGTATTVTVGRSARRDTVDVRVVVKDWKLAVACGYAIVERAITSPLPVAVLTIG